MTDVKSTEQPIIKVRDLGKFFGPTHVIKGVHVLLSEVVLIMGPSGGGKSTFLRCLNFLDEPSGGKIEIDGAGIQTRGPARQRQTQMQGIRRNATMVFQEFNLSPHMSVLGNVIEGVVTVKGVPKQHAIAKAEELLLR